MSRTFVEARLQESVSTGVFENLPISKLRQSPFSVRGEDSFEISSIASSVREIGLLHPLVVRPASSGYFDIIAGHRRFRACKQLGHRKVACYVVEADDKRAFEVALVENTEVDNESDRGG